MAQVAQTYLGNISQDSNLAELVANTVCLKVSLSQNQHHKSRIYAHTDKGVAIGIIKNRDRLLQSGDVFQTESERLILVHLQEQKLLVIDLSDIDKNVAATKLVHMGHILGNNHYPIAIQDDKIYVPITTESNAIEKAIADLQIPGLQITYEMQSLLANNTFTSHTH